MTAIFRKKRRRIMPLAPMPLRYFLASLDRRSEDVRILPVIITEFEFGDIGKTKMTESPFVNKPEKHGSFYSCRPCQPAATSSTRRSSGCPKGPSRIPKLP
jgi:hypothetical protein